MSPISGKHQFLKLAALFEGALVVLAIGLGWLVKVNPFQWLTFDFDALGVGIMGTLPLLLVFGWSYRLPVPQLRQIKRLLIDTLGPYLSACRWYELVFVALLAGFCEEILFRGVLQPWMESLWGYWPALLVSNLVFGLAHSVTPLYTLLATATGIYLGWMLDVGGHRNLLVPMIIHTLYDFVAFVMVVKMYRIQIAGHEAD